MATKKRRTRRNPTRVSSERWIGEAIQQHIKSLRSEAARLDKEADYIYDLWKAQDYDELERMKII